MVQVTDASQVFKVPDDTKGRLKLKITHYCPGTPSKQFNTDTKLRYTQSYVQEAHRSGYKDRWYRRIKNTTNNKQKNM